MSGAPDLLCRLGSSGASIRPTAAGDQPWQECCAPSGSSSTMSSSPAATTAPLLPRTDSRHPTPRAVADVPRSPARRPGDPDQGHFARRACSHREADPMHPAALLPARAGPIRHSGPAPRHPGNDHGYWPTRGRQRARHNRPTPAAELAGSNLPLPRSGAAACVFADGGGFRFGRYTRRNTDKLTGRNGRRSVGIASF
jgi:hypothetical protein